MKKWCLLALLAFIPSLLIAELPLGKIPPKVVLSGENGGRVDGSDWSSSELKGKLFVIFYVDPDESELNEHVAKALRDEDYRSKSKKYSSIAIVNLDATLLPNFLIERKLKSKQAENPDTLFVTDKEKVLVEKWNMKDDSSNIMAINAKGKVIFSKGGKLSPEEVAELIKIVNKSLGLK